VLPGFEPGPFSGERLVPNPRGHWIIINVQVQLGRVADLTQSSQLHLLETTVQEPTGDWRGYWERPTDPKLKPPYWTNVPSQRLGRALYQVRGLEGFLTYSARFSTRRNLIIFPRKLRRGNFVRFENPITGQTHTLP
jgi:hypothetical protein